MSRKFKYPRMAVRGRISAVFGAQRSRISYLYWTAVSILTTRETHLERDLLRGCYTSKIALELCSSILSKLDMGVQGNIA